MKGRTVLAAIVVLCVVVAGIFVYAWGASAPVLSSTRTASQETSDNSARIETFAIEPSERDGEWTTYATGAKITLRGIHIKAATIYYFPTGTGVGEAQPDGFLLGPAELRSRVGDQSEWVLLLPDGLLLTNLWAVVTGDNEQQLKSKDLGSVAYRS